MQFGMKRLAAATALAFVALAPGLATAAADPAPAAAARSGPPPIEAFGKLPHVENVVISPSGKRTALVMGTDKGRYVVVVENHKPVMSQEFSEDRKGTQKGKVRSLHWADDDHLMVTLTKTEDLRYYDGHKFEASYICVINVAKRSGFWVFDHKVDVLPAVMGREGVSHADGHVYGYFRGQAMDGERLLDRVDLFKVDLDSGELHKVAMGNEGNRFWLLGTDGAILAYTDYDDKGQGWRLYDAHHTLLAQDKNPYDSASIDGQGRTPGTILYDMPTKEHGFVYYERALVKDAQPVRMFEGQMVDYPMFDRRTGLLEGVATSGDYPKVTFYDPVKQARWAGAQKAFDKLNSRLASADEAFDQIVVFGDGEGDPGTYWRIDFSGSSGQAEMLGEAYPGIPSEAVGQRTVVDYKAQDGLQLHAILTLPPGRDAKNLPVIVMPHGGPHARDDLAFDWLSAAFASRGYAVIQPNFRGSSGYGYEFAQAGFGEWGKKMQTDVSDALRALAAKGVVDPKRACTVGWSYGGYAALAGVTVQHGLYRCAVSVAGVSDLKAMLYDEADQHADESADVRYWKDMMGAKRLDDAALRDISPAKLADKADAPILLIHGKDDTIVPIEQSLIMQRALKNAGKSVELIQIDSDDHHMSREVSRVAMLKAAIAFVEKYDPPN